MSKELFVSSTPRETKVAIVEDDQLTEVYFERENEYTLAGSIYKGRVTRVLPGMQSAFVNVGLERDAFLYVSDFLLDEEEDAEVLEHVTPPPPLELQEPEAHAEPQQPIEAEEIIPPIEDIESGGHIAAEPNPGDENGDAAAEEQGREGARKWRGRRRRGRGRDRFQERSEHQEREPQPAAEPPARVPQAQAPSAPSTEPPLVLPGESISKYQPHSAAQPPAQPQASSAPQPKVKASTEYSLDSAQFTPGSMVLPGESLSKYRNRAVSAPEPVAAPAKVEEPAHETAVAEEPPAQAETPVVTAFPQTHEEEVHHEEEAHHAAEQPSAAKEEEQKEEKEEKRFEDMNVAAVFGGEAVEAPEQQHEPVPSAQPEATESKPAQPWYGAAPGVVEEEEIEEEESEFLDFEDDRLELADFEELEEEELAPADDQMVAMGREITEAVRDAHVIEHATGQYEAEGLETGEEEETSGEAFLAHEHEAEAVAEEDDELDLAEEITEEQEELTDARAEARGPIGTAGYQQRADRKPERRFGRRMGGKRMRGRPRHHVQRQMPAISDLLKEGQEILVQIAKEPIAKKGARITSHIALPGRFLVYMPTVHHTGVSRKIASEEERHRLKRIVLSERGEAHGGFIVRTAAAGANEDDLRADIRFLINLWTEIRGRAEKAKAPALIYHDLNLVERILRDQVTINFSSIWVDSEQEYERILRFVSRFQSSLVKRVKLYTKETPLFEQFNISEEINKALKSKVWLKSGGYIVINQTEALVAIDINTGKYVGKTARLEDTIVKTNIDAIREIVRQIRLRDLGGIIVIDFIDMDERKNRQRVMQALEEALKADRAPSKVLQFNDFGLVAITRKRVKQSLERTLGQQCPICTGTGMIKSVATVCNEIYVEMRKMSRHFEHDVILRVHPEVAKSLKSNGARWLQDMEELTKQTILVKSDPLLHPEQFDIQ